MNRGLLRCRLAVTDCPQVDSGSFAAAFGPCIGVLEQLDLSRTAVAALAGNYLNGMRPTLRSLNLSGEACRALCLPGIEPWGRGRRLRLLSGAGCMHVTGQLLLEIIGALMEERPPNSPLRLDVTCCIRASPCCLFATARDRSDKTSISIGRSDWTRFDG